MKITAVVLTFWPNRTGNVQAIVDSLVNSSVVPDHIMAWNNNPDQVVTGIQGADAIINSPVNYECRAKFIAAQLVHADYFVMCDDDTAVGHRTVESIVAQAEQLTEPGEPFASGYWGVRLTGRSFMTGAIFQPDSIAKPTHVDAFHGRVMVMNTEALARTMSLEALVRDKWPTEGDDLIAGLANLGFSWALPLRGDERFVDLDEGGQAMQHAPGYFKMRDEFCGDVLDAAARWKKWTKGPGDLGAE